MSDLPRVHRRHCRWLTLGRFAPAYTHFMLLGRCSGHAGMCAAVRLTHTLHDHWPPMQESCFDSVQATADEPAGWCLECLDSKAVCLHPSSHCLNFSAP